MKNNFCDLSQEHIQNLKIPIVMRGLLLSPFQFNDDGKWVAVPRETFKEFVDVVAAHAVYLSSQSIENFAGGLVGATAKSGMIGESCPPATEIDSRLIVRQSQRATVQALTDSSAALVEVMTRYEELVKTLLEAKKAGVGL